MGRKLALPGPYIHLQKGLLITEDASLDLQMRFMVDDGMTEDQLVSEIIGLIWPSSTALTLLSPPFINAKASEFHQERIHIAGGKPFKL